MRTRNKEIMNKAIEYANKTAKTEDEYFHIIEQGLVWGFNPETGEPNPRNAKRPEYISELNTIISKSDKS
jgi:hypothetical protein